MPATNTTSSDAMRGASVSITWSVFDTAKPSSMPFLM